MELVERAMLRDVIDSPTRPKALDRRMRILAAKEMLGSLLDRGVVGNKIYRCMMDVKFCEYESFLR